LDEIRRRFDVVQYQVHAVGAMQERGFTVRDVQEAVLGPNAEVVEESTVGYGPTSLVLGWCHEGRVPLHVLFGAGATLWIITVYDPSTDPKQRFEAPDFRKRRERP